MEFKPQIIPNKNIETENQSFSPEKFLDWNPFNPAITDICFSAIEESREIVDSKIFKLKERIDEYFLRLGINHDYYDNAFNQILNSANTNEVIQKLADIMEEIVVVFRNRLPEAEKIEREEWEKFFKIKEVNQLVGYNEPDFFSQEIINIHILPNRTTSTNEKIKLFKEGFSGIAEIVNSNEKIKKIMGDSWIAFEHPEIIKKLGFKFEKNFKEEFKRIFIEKNKKKSEVISMSREEFLKKYLI